MKAFKTNEPDRLPLERYAQARREDGTLLTPEPLSHYRDVPAWVLLADPGAGKTDTFKSLCAAEGGCYITARDFVDLNLPAHWGAPLFIDGLDEVTAGNATGSTTFSQIRTKLQQLETPKFRLACREADWRGNADSDALQRLVGDRIFLELHLEPITREQTRALIAHWQQSTAEKAEEFIQEAEHRDLSGLLENPQTLRMLVKAVASKKDGWPTSKIETYALACAQLVQEHNASHREAQQDSVLSAAQLREAAGYLCAVMLLSGSATMARQPTGEAYPGIMALTALHYDKNAPVKAACNAALHTRLFRGTGSHEFAPVHRTVAEYLGASYLNARIAGGLPASRVLALMMGEDAGIVPELRGLHAWLAASASGELRRELIERDPLGVVLNGDVRQFTHAEKLQVLQALRNEATRYTYFRNQNWTSHPFGALATADMESDFKVLLQSDDRSLPHMALLDCVLDALIHGHQMHALAPALEQLVRDKTYWSGLRTAALHILVTYAQAEGNNSSLTQLLADVHSNRVEDLEDELLGKLLKTLYPTRISPTELWRYFRKPKSDRLIGTYWRFWRDLAKTATSLKKIPELLDALLESDFQLKQANDRRDASEVVGKLLMHGVQQHAETIDINHLHGWLSLGLGAHSSSQLQIVHKAPIGQWLGQHPKIYKRLFEHGLKQLITEGENALHQLWRIYSTLYDAKEPDDVEEWYLSLAEALANDNLRRQLLYRAFDAAERKNGPDAAIQLLEKWNSDHPCDRAWVAEQLCRPYPPPKYEQEHIDSKIRHKEREDEESRQQINFFRQTLPSFDTGPAHLGALVAIGNAYLNFFGESNKTTADDRLFELLNQNGEWVNLALKGLRQSLYRDDLPSCEEIVDLNIKGSQYNLAVPCLAAMALRSTENAGSALDLPPSTLETVATFLLTSHFNERPAWFKQLLAQEPDLLATVMSCLMGQQIAAKKENADGLFALACDPDYATIAKQITNQLSANFPVKASQKQLNNLRLLILSVLNHLDRETQLTLIASKLCATNMDVTQHTYWLTAGVLLAPELYLERIQQFAGKSQVRTNHVFALIHERSDRGYLKSDLPVTTHVFLIGLLGPRSSPSWASGSGWVTPEMEMGRYVAGLISALASNPDDAAMQALTQLQQRPDLRQWHDSLNRALYDQRIARRKARFKPAAVADVCATLANLNPANAADLWALTVDHLQQLAREIRDSNTDDYEQYWAGDRPKSEELCRNALLSALKRVLAPMGITAEPERLHPDEKRADIEVAAGLHHIPIEIKGEWHKDVWKAIGNQLIAQYCREPASNGYGIYVVFWFTGDMKAAPTDGGAKVKTPHELQKRLAATVPEALKHKIAVLVVDCSKPSVAQFSNQISL